MRDFRFLDEKRKVGGLSPAEEQRWLELRAVLGIPEAPAISSYVPQEHAGETAHGYWADDGNWYPYPHPAAAPGEGAYDPNAAWQAGTEPGWDAWANAPAEGYAPDPNWGPGYGYPQQAEPYDAGAQTQGQYDGGWDAQAWAQWTQQQQAEGQWAPAHGVSPDNWVADVGFDQPVPEPQPAHWEGEVAEAQGAFEAPEAMSPVVEDEPAAVVTSGFHEIGISHEEEAEPVRVVSDFLSVEEHDVAPATESDETPVIEATDFDAVEEELPAGEALEEPILEASPEVDATEDLPVIEVAAEDVADFAAAPVVVGVEEQPVLEATPEEVEAADVEVHPVLESTPELEHSDDAQPTLEVAPEAELADDGPILEVASGTEHVDAQPVIELAPEIEHVAQPVIGAAPEIEHVAQPVLEAAPEVEHVDAQPVLEAAPEIEHLDPQPVIDAAPEIEQIDAQPVLDAAPEIEQIDAQPGLDAAPEIEQIDAQPVLEAASEGEHVDAQPILDAAPEVEHVDAQPVLEAAPEVELADAEPVLEAAPEIEHVDAQPILDAAPEVEHVDAQPVLEAAPVSAEAPDCTPLPDDAPTPPLGFEGLLIDAATLEEVEPAPSPVVAAPEVESFDVDVAEAEEPFDDLSVDVAVAEAIAGAEPVTDGSIEPSPTIHIDPALYEEARLTDSAEGEAPVEATADIVSAEPELSGAPDDAVPSSVVDDLPRWDAELSSLSLEPYAGELPAVDSTSQAALAQDVEVELEISSPNALPLDAEAATAGGEIVTGSELSPPHVEIEWDAAEAMAEVAQALPVVSQDEGPPHDAEAALLADSDVAPPPVADFIPASPPLDFGAAWSSQLEVQAEPAAPVMIPAESAPELLAAFVPLQELPEPEPAEPAPASASAEPLPVIELVEEVEEEEEELEELEELALVEEVDPVPLAGPGALDAAQRVVTPASVPVSMAAAPAVREPEPEPEPDEAAIRAQLFGRSVDLSAPAAPTVTAWVEGEHRVILHTVEGQVKRGLLRDADLLDEVVTLEGPTGTAPESVPTGRLKAVFFMLPAGSRPAIPAGKKLRVTFNDGRQVAGYCSDYGLNDPGFFLVPAENRTNTARIFIYRTSVQSVQEG